MMSNKQIEYLTLYRNGMTQSEIAKKLGVSPSTVSRTIKRALRKTCPFSPDCRKCPLNECAIKDEYVHLVNNTENALFLDKRRTNQWA